MFCTLIISRYPKYFGVFGFLSMMIFRFPLYLNRSINFFKLMGSGKNGTFDKKPDFNQWAILFVAERENIAVPSFITKYFKIFSCDVKEFLLEPIEGHGLWDGKKIFGALSKKINDDEPIAVLTRATIRLNRLKNFWSNVDKVSAKMKDANGFVLSYGIGEIPWIKQATFSIWENKDSMKKFAYSMQAHAEVIRKTRHENWYKEELFVRFRILSVKGFSNRLPRKCLTCNPHMKKHNSNDQLLAIFLNLI